MHRETQREILFDALQEKPNEKLPKRGRLEPSWCPVCARGVVFYVMKHACVEEGILSRRAGRGGKEQKHTQEEDRSVGQTHSEVGQKFAPR